MAHTLCGAKKERFLFSQPRAGTARYCVRYRYGCLYFFIYFLLIFIFMVIFIFAKFFKIVLHESVQHLALFLPL